MGITASYKRITPQKFAEIQNDIEAAASGASQFCQNKICSGSILLPNVQEAG
ncbi:MAG: hypothetical protein V7K27_08425 [Nostoc sp.]|uniref:hypothetical protein n=1 Tax=Nostoc sp. TaxID=1180 RepID=UPI002FF7EF20